MKSSFTKAHISVLAGASLLAIASNTMAQRVEEKPPETDPSPKQPSSSTAGEALAEIVVTARRRDESVQDVPAVVNPVTAETIEKLNLRRFQDIQSVVPGLSIIPNANGIGAETVVRGIRFDVNVSGNFGTVQYYLNDAPITGGSILQAMYDIGQIEVLRGPQGTLRGRPSPSGAINIVTRTPDLSEMGGYFNGTANDIDGWNVNGAFNLPLVSDKLAVRVAGLSAEDESNRVQPVTGAVLQPTNETQSGRASVSADPFEGLLLLDFSYQTLSRESLFYDQVQSGNQVISTLGPSPAVIRPKDRAAYRGLPRQNEQDFDVYGWQGQLNVWGQRLTYVGNKTEQHLRSFAPTDAAGLFDNQAAALFIFNSASPSTPRLVQPTQTVAFGQPTDTRSSDTSHEVRLQNEERIADRLDYVIGYLNYDTGSDTDFQQIIGPIGAPPTLNGVLQLPLQRFGDNKEESVFGNVTVHLGAGTEISGGARRIRYETHSGLRVFNVNADTFVENSAVRQDEEHEATIYSASIKHEFNDDLMAYASFGTSWRPNAIAIGGPTQPSVLQVQFLRTPPEKSDSYEIGVKTDFLDDRLRVNVSAFYQEFKNYPYRAPGVGVFAIDVVRGAGNPASNAAVNPFNYVAAVPVTVKGIEGEISFTPSRNFSIGAVLSYAEGEIDNGNVPCLDLDNNGIPDLGTTRPTGAALFADVGTNFIDVCQVTQRASATPKFSASVQSEYSRPVTDSIDGYLRGLFFYNGNSLNDPVNRVDDVDDYGILNLYAGVRDPDGLWEISLYGKNITDTFRVLTRTSSVLTSGALSGNNFFGITVTEPREFGINLRLAFGSR